MNLYATATQVVLGAVLGVQSCVAQPALRVCADPNNLPFSNRAREGLENRLAAWIAQDMRAPLSYTWWAQRRGFLRNTLRAGQCDVVLGLPVGIEGVLTTRPYYRSCYALVFRRNAGYVVSSLDDPLLRELRIGVHVVGGNNPPPAEALAARGIIHNVTGYSIYGDYRQPNPPARLIDAVAAGAIDVAVAWGPFAGYFAPRQVTALTVQALPKEDQKSAQPMAFSIAMGLRPGDSALRNRLDRILQRLQPRINTLLRAYGVPECVDTGGQAARAVASAAMAR